MADETVVETTDTTGEEKKATAEQEAAAKAAETAAKEGEGEEKTPEQIEAEKAAAEAADKKAAEETEKEKNRLGFEKRQREKRRLHDLELENARLKGFKEAMEKGAKPSTDSKPDASALEAEFSATDPEPKEDDFKTFAEYNRALSRWSARLERFAESKTDATKTQESQAGEIRKAIASQKEKGEAEFEDFGEVISDLSLTPTMLEEIYASPEGHKIAYHLGMNPKEQDRIAALSAKAQIKEIAKLESKIESGAIQLKKPVSKAPEPAPKPGPKGPASGEIAADMDMEAYAARRSAGKG